MISGHLAALTDWDGGSEKMQKQRAEVGGLSVDRWGITKHGHWPDPVQASRKTLGSGTAAQTQCSPEAITDTCTPAPSWKPVTVGQKAAPGTSSGRMGTSQG